MRGDKYMNQKSMTALISAFSRAYHSTQNTVKIFDDYLAKNLLTESEYTQISKSMTAGINFFNPSFTGTEDEALRWIVDNQLSPTPLGRAAFAERALQTAVRIGATQYLIFAAGYDTFAYRQPDWAKNIQIFEIDHPATSQDKQERMKSFLNEIPSNVHYIPGDFTLDNWESRLLALKTFDHNALSFCSLLGISYYLSTTVFTKTIKAISSLIPKGSSIIFDYPDADTYSDKAAERAKKQVAMAGAASEEMRASYSYREIEKLLANHHFLIYEHLTPEEITDQYFKGYNQANPEHPMRAFDNVNYCLAVRN